MSLMVVGTVAIDHVRTPSGIQEDMLGGSAAHFCMSARLFTKVHLAAVVGEDFPKKHLSFLRKKGIDVSSLLRVPGKTFRWRGEYKNNDFNTALTLATEIGVLMGYNPQVASHQKSLPNVFLANIDPDIQMGLLSMMKSPRLIGLDSMNLWINTKRDSLLKLMKRVDLFVANDGEAKQMTGEQNLIKAARALRKIGPRWIVVKKGEHGVLFYSDKIKFSFPAFPIDHVVDPTGAGDTFAGALMGYLSKAKTINKANFKKALIYATTIASFNVEGFGMAKTATLAMPQVNKRMKELLEFIDVD